MVQNSDCECRKQVAMPKSGLNSWDAPGTRVIVGCVQERYWMHAAQKEAQMSIASELSEAALDFQYDNIPPEVIREMKRLMLDALACAIGAFDADPCRICRDFARETAATKPLSLVRTAKFRCRRRSSPTRQWSATWTSMTSCTSPKVPEKSPELIPAMRCPPPWPSANASTLRARR